MTSGINVVFDTCAAISLLKGKVDLSSLDIDIDESFQYVSVITRMEIFAKNDMKPEEEEAVRNFLADVTVIPLGKIVEQKAIEIRRTTKIKLPDCIIAATAIALDAVLITNDSHLLYLSFPGYKVTNASKKVSGNGSGC